MAEQVTAIFVYGTLQRGQCREGCWPRRPASVEAATTLGRLFDLGAYPALVEGEHVVAGELWRFDAVDMSETLAVLDRVENFFGRPDDLYRRVVVECRAPGGFVSAYTYHFCSTERAAAGRLIRPDDEGVCRWP